jgi:hypothetical protein
VPEPHRAPLRQNGLPSARCVGVTALAMPESAAEFEAKAKVRREKVKADTEAKAARDLGIPEASSCFDPRCAVCTVPDVCEQCKSGATLVQTPPARVDTPPAFDAGGWEVDDEMDDEVSRADWPKVCQACSTGCRACDNPSPAGCTACFPMYDSALKEPNSTLILALALALPPNPNPNPDPSPSPALAPTLTRFDLGPQGCSASFKAFAMLSGVSVLVILISAYLTRLNWNKFQRIRQVRATKLVKNKGKKAR